MLAGLRFTSLRLRLVVVFGLVALTAAVSASGHRVLAQPRGRADAYAGRGAARLPAGDAEPRGVAAAATRRRTNCSTRPGRWPSSSQRFSVLLVAEDDERQDGRRQLRAWTPSRWTTCPTSLQKAVNKQQPVTSGNTVRVPPVLAADHRRTASRTWSAARRSIGGGPTGYMLKSLEPERKDLNSLAWSLGIATALALIGSALLAQAAATTVLQAGAPARRSRPGGSARASSTPGCGSPARTNSPISRGRSTRRPRPWRSGSRT